MKKFRQGAGLNDWIQRHSGTIGAWQLPIRDDAGAERALLPARALPTGTARLNRMRDRAQLVYADLFSFRRIVTRVIILVLPLCVLMPFLMTWTGRAGLAPAWIGGGIALFLIPLNSLWMRRDFRRLSPRAGEVADACLDEGVCPCCAYNLAGVVGVVGAHRPESGELVRCPECGAEWKRDRIHHVDNDETHAARETPSLHAVIRAQGVLYNSMAFRDDEGRPVSLARFMDLLVLRKHATGEHRSRLDGCVRLLRFRGLWKRLLVASLVLPMTIGIVVEFSRRPLSAMGMMQGLEAIGLVMWLIGSVAILRSDIGRGGAKRAELLKAKGLCPACGEVIEGDGEMRKCGECRAVWRVGDVSNPTP